MFTSYFYKFLELFSRGYEIRLLLLLFMSVIAGFMEFIGIALIFPLIVLILQPQNVYSLPVLADVAKSFGAASTVSLLGVGVVLVFIAKNLFMIANSYTQISVLKNWQADLNLIMFRKYLFSTYESKLTLPAKYSLFQVWQLCSLVFSGFVSRVLSLVSNLVILLVILVFLVWKFRIWAILTGCFFIVFGLLQNNFFKTKGREYTKKRISLMNDGNQSIISAIKNIKDIKIFAKEEFFYSLYQRYSKSFARVDIFTDFFGSIPQNIVEICIILAILIMSIGVVNVSNGNSEVMIASFGMLAAAVFRMAPLVNKIQMHMNFVNANKPVVQEFFAAYETYDKIPITQGETNEKFKLRNNIEIKKLTYSYGDKNVLSDVTLEIKKGEFIGIIGRSGVGKTTFADILMGLLTTYSGEIFADGERLCEKSAQRWLNSIGYVPQEITTLPLSIAQNIAFGVEEDKIDYDKVMLVVQEAQLGDYVSGLENGVRTKLNDIQGLSQGQKQRIGIARALYIEPEILVLDEVTSALDLETENKITQCLDKLKGEKTIIAIAHRLSTLKNCDRIFYFKSEKEVLCGTFEQLMQDLSFEKLVKLASIC